jgi:hypothetical protein
MNPTMAADGDAIEHALWRRSPRARTFPPIRAILWAMSEISRTAPSVDRRVRPDAVPPATTPKTTTAPPTADVLAKAAVNNDRAALAAAAVTAAPADRGVTPALPALPATEATPTAPATLSEAMRAPVTVAGQAAVLEAVAERAGIPLRSAPATEQHLQMAMNDAMLVQRALTMATPQERAAGIPDPTNPGGTIRVTPEENASITGANTLAENRGIPSLRAAERHVMERFTERAAGGPEQAAALQAAYATMTPAQRAEVAEVGRAADLEANAPGFTEGFVDGVRDSVTGVADAAAFAASMATDPAARARFEQDASTISAALRTPEGRAAVQEALGDQAQAFFDKGPAYVSGYIAGQVAAGAATGGATAVAGRAAVQGLRLVQPEVVAAATRALEASRAVVQRAALPTVAAGAALLASSTEAQAAVGEIATLASGAGPLAVTAAVFGPSVAQRLSAPVREALGGLLRRHVDAGDTEAAARLVDNTRDAMRLGQGESVVQAAVNTQRIADVTAALPATVGPGFARAATDAVRLNDPVAARAALRDLDAARLNSPDAQAMHARLTEIARRTDAEGTFAPTIDHARNAALEAFGRMPHGAALTQGRLHDAAGRINGIRTPDGRTMRIDWDPEKGLHYNVTEAGGRNGQAFVVEGSPAETYRLYLSELERYQR